MKTPRWMIGLALLFWGWETGLLMWAALMAAVLEGAPWIKARWEFADTDLNRICDLCLVLFLGAGTLLYSTEDRLVFIFKWAQWMPFCFFPVALAQAYGDRPTMPLSAFSWLLRSVKHSPLARISFNVSYGYYAICVLGASASTRADQYFYMGVSALILLALASVRPRRVSWTAWITLAAVVVLCGRVSHQGLRQLQNRLEGALGGWLAEMFRSNTDPHEVRTSIGRGGRLPLSSKIVLRLRVGPGDIPPSLLREGAYDAYRKGTWTAGTNEFAPVSLTSNGTYHIPPPKKNFSRVEIAGYFPEGKGVLPLPHGTFELEDFQGVLRTNRLGVADSESGPGLLDFEADYFTGPSFDGPPSAIDLAVPDDEKAVLRSKAADLGLDQMSNDRQKIRAVSSFFQDHFNYTLDIPINYGTNTPLGHFLYETKSGHCEYFATATVLLLRQAGVPARYITGHAVPESARHGDTYLVRERYNHAWALVYHTNTATWEQIDNTPSSWADVAEAHAPWWQPTSDFLSNIYFRFSQWRWGKTSFARYAQWALAPLILYLVWRILSTRRRQQNAAGHAAGHAEPVWPGLDSELYLINRRLEAVHLARQPNETLDQWQHRLEEAFPASRTLESIFQMHRRLRFDPRGLASQERETLRRQAENWLAEFQTPMERREQAGVGETRISG